VVWLGALGGDVRFAFTSRTGGLSAPPFDELNLSLDVGNVAEVVERNRASVLDRIDLGAAAWLRAQHGRDVHVIDGAVTADDAARQGDGLVTTATGQGGYGLAALSADCALVVLADPAVGVVGCLHCGRQGLVAGVVEAVVQAMRDLGARSLRAAIGPTICGSCYEVPPDMAAAVVAVVPAAAARARSGGAGLDIRAGVLDQLSRAGVPRVRLVGGCTFEDPETFSYRRDHVTGRMGALVWRASRALSTT
jgi:YfiH family protein